MKEQMVSLSFSSISFVSTILYDHNTGDCTNMSSEYMSVLPMAAVYKAWELVDDFDGFVTRVRDIFVG